MLLFCASALSATEPVGTSTLKKGDSKPAIVYATLMPKVSSFSLKIVQVDGGAEANLVSDLNYGSEFSWGLTNERLHFMLFGEVMKVSLVAPKSTTVIKELSDSTLTLAKGGLGLGLHPGRTRDFFALLFCSFEQTLFTYSDSSNTSKIFLSRVTIPHVGIKLAFTTLRWKFLNLGADLNAGYAFATSNAEEKIRWGFNGFGRMVLGIETSEKMNIEIAPQFGYSKYYTELASQSRVDAGVSLGVRLFLD